MPRIKHCCCGNILCTDNTLRDCVDGKCVSVTLSGYSNNTFCIGCENVNGPYLASAALVGLDSPICGYNGCHSFPIDGSCDGFYTLLLTLYYDIEVDALGNVLVTVEAITWTLFVGIATFLTYCKWESTSADDLAALCRGWSQPLVVLTE